MEGKKIPPWAAEPIPSAGPPSTSWGSETGVCTSPTPEYRCITNLAHTLLCQLSGAFSISKASCSLPKNGVQGKGCVWFSAATQTKNTISHSWRCTQNGTDHSGNAHPSAMNPSQRNSGCPADSSTGRAAGPGREGSTSPRRRSEGRALLGCNATANTIPDTRGGLQAMALGSHQPWLPLWQLVEEVQTPGSTSWAGPSLGQCRQHHEPALAVHAPHQGVLACPAVPWHGWLQPNNIRGLALHHPVPQPSLPFAAHGSSACSPTSSALFAFGSSCGKTRLSANTIPLTPRRRKGAVVNRSGPWPFDTAGVTSCSSLHLRSHCITLLLLLLLLERPELLRVTHPDLAFLAD